MPTLFDGTDEVVCRALGIARRGSLGNPNGSPESLSSDAASALVRDLFACLEGNYAGQPRSASQELWACRRATLVDAGNRRAETLLEKAVANLADAGHMPGWFNQCPVASGVVDPYADGSRCIDLVHCAADNARFVELKWASQGPAYALFQILEYGLAYIFAWQRKHELGVANRPLMSVREIRLEVLGPGKFYQRGHKPELFRAVHEALHAFVAERTAGDLSMSLQALAFPADFRRVPFRDGGEVGAHCGGGDLTPAARNVCEAFSNVRAKSPATTR